MKLLHQAVKEKRCLMLLHALKLESDEPNIFKQQLTTSQLFEEEPNTITTNITHNTHGHKTMTALTMFMIIHYKQRPS